MYTHVPHPDPASTFAPDSSAPSVTSVSSVLKRCPLTLRRD
jgi:hypothetical protein